jgi:hypothetical protein
MTSEDIVRTIIAGNLSNTQLNDIITSIKFARVLMVRDVKNTLHVGSQVRWTNSRNNQTLTGNVTKVAVKFVSVNTPLHGSWRIPAHMLTLV